MLTILLGIIYIAFISLGLPDAILGAGWPMIHQELGVPISAAGLATMVVCGGTILSSFFSGRCLKRYGTGVVTVVSIFLTAIGLLGTYVAPSFFWVCVLCIPMGIGAGAVDAALNHFVALHYEAKHMNWLHCFWGVGATAGPLIMSFFLLSNQSWRNGYGTIGLLQLGLVLCCFLTLPLWKKFEDGKKTEQEEPIAIDTKSLLAIKGAKPALIAFFCYCAVEATAGLWASSYLVMSRGISAENAAQWVSVFYLGITIGRFVAGFVAMKLNNIKMIKIGISICFIGIMLLVLPFSNYIQLVGLICIGLGCAPIYPAMLHETPNRFGKEVSQGIMGIQMATAYIGSTFMPPLFGIIAKTTTFSFLPYFLCGLVVVMFITSERVNKICG